MTEFLLVGDIHLSDKPPSSCTDTYLDDLFDLLEQTVTLANEAGAVPIWAGDVFHVKTPGRTSHKTVQRAMRLMESYTHRLRIVPGNHDMQHDRFDSLFETQPLGVLLEAGALLLQGWDREFPEIYGVPWLQGYGPEGTVPQPLIEGMNDWRAANLRAETDTTNCLVIAHAPLYPPGFELEYEFFSARTWAGLMNNRGSCYYGHVHERHGQYEVDGVKFCNDGAITRGSLHESDLKRKVAVTFWNTETGFREVLLDAKPVSEVFRLTEKIEERETAARLDEFLSGIGSTQLEVMSIESVVASIREKGLGEDVTRLAIELLEGVAH